MNGLLAGHVAITGSCNNVESYSAVIIGILAGFCYILSCRLLFRFKVDDPLHASQIHAFCGLWGLVAVGIFDNDKGLIYTGKFN